MSMHSGLQPTLGFSASWILVGQTRVAHAVGDLHKVAIIMREVNALSALGDTLFDPNDQRDREKIEATIRVALSEQE